MGVLKEHTAPLGARESCSQELPDLSQTSCVVLLGLLFLLLIGLMEERLEEKKDLREE